jgi:citrate synthase
MGNRGDLTAREAADELGISPATLYAYVSRGLIHSEPGPSGSRQRRYRRADVEALKERQAQRRDPARSAETALSWGTPVLESAITLIEGGRLYYRGHDALALARSARFENVVDLLWESDGDTESPTLTTRHESTSSALSSLGPLERLQARLPLLAVSDPSAYDLRPRSIRRAGRAILETFVAEIAGQPVFDGIARTLAEDLAPGIEGAARLLDAALIISADHELNASSFTVRCVASTGAPLYDAIGAGIGALRGVRHGAASRRVEALLNEVASPERATTVLDDRLRRGERIPGFGHLLYPEGDPRGALLIDLCREVASESSALALIDAVITAAHDLIDERPNVDFGLVAVTRVLGLASGSALNLMALGRMAGWVAHALEQYDQQRMIRPRARYVGPQPSPPAPLPMLGEGGLRRTCT